MKRIPVDECPAGRAIDVAVAIAGYDKNLVVDFEYGLIATSKMRLREALESGWIGWDSILKGEAGSFCLESPKYSTDIVAAWDLMRLESMAIIPLKSDRWLAIPYSAIPDDYTAYKIDLTDGEIASTAPLAIARAYLKARGVEFVEVPEELCDA